MHSLLDKEDEKEVVKDNYHKFQQMYQPIWQQHFKDCFSLADGKFEISHDAATRKHLMSHVNDNVYQNITHTVSLSSYDTDKKLHKIALEPEKKEEIINEVIRESETKGTGKEGENKEFA